jgi:hypothetical protein
LAFVDGDYLKDDVESSPIPAAADLPAEKSDFTEAILDIRVNTYHTYDIVPC